VWGGLVLTVLTDVDDLARIDREFGALYGKGLAVAVVVRRESPALAGASEEHGLPWFDEQPDLPKLLIRLPSLEIHESLDAHCYH
jgi:hypothetical protein